MVKDDKTTSKSFGICLRPETSVIFGVLHRKRVKEMPNIFFNPLFQIIYAHSSLFLTYANNLNAQIGRWKYILANQLPHSKQWTYMMAVYSGGAFPVSPWRTATWLAQPMRRPNDSFVSSIHPISPSRTILSSCQVVRCQGDGLFCFWFVASASSNILSQPCDGICLIPASTDKTSLLAPSNGTAFNLHFILSFYIANFQKICFSLSRKTRLRSSPATTLCNSHPTFVRPMLY